MHTQIPPDGGTTNGFIVARKVEYGTTVHGGGCDSNCMNMTERNAGVKPAATTTDTARRKSS